MFSFMPNYLLFYAHGETHNQRESTIFGSLIVQQVLCEFSCLYILIWCKQLGTIKQRGEKCFLPEFNANLGVNFMTIKLRENNIPAFF